jgi:hypothetical protein
VLHSCSGNRPTRSPRWARHDRVLPPLRSRRTGSAGARSLGRRLPRLVAVADSTASARCRRRLRRPPTLPSVPGSSATMAAPKERALPPRRRGLPRLRGTTCPSATPARWTSRSGSYRTSPASTSPSGTSPTAPGSCDASGSGRVSPTALRFSFSDYLSNYSLSFLTDDALQTREVCRAECEAVVGGEQGKDTHSVPLRQEW